MKEILDVIVVILFAFLVFVFIRGFNEQQVEKHKKKLKDIEQRMKERDE